MENSCAAIGTFDGMHTGHKGLIAKLLEISKKRKHRSIIVSLSKPVHYVSGLLSTPKEKLALLKKSGANEVYVLKADKALTNISAESFFNDFLLKTLKAKHLVVGKNFAFGHGRKGDIKWLKKNCPRKKVGLTIKSFVCSHRKQISSSRIRTLLHQGRIRLASRLLGRLYTFEGVHIKGRGVGTKLGMPTINLKVDPAKLLPLGVFLVVVEAKGKLYPAIANIGTRPTFFKHGSVVPEIYLLGFRGSWKSRNIRVYLLNHIRKERKFKTVNELKKQLNKDLSKARRYFGFTF